MGSFDVPKPLWGREVLFEGCQNMNQNVETQCKVEASRPLVSSARQNQCWFGWLIGKDEGKMEKQEQ